MSEDNKPLQTEDQLPVFSLHYQAHEEFDEEHTLVALESDRAYAESFACCVICIQCSMLLERGAGPR